MQRKHRIALFLRVFICATLCNAPHLLYLISFAIFELPAFDKTNKCPGSSHYSLELLKLPENCELLRWGTECAVLQWLLPLAFIPPLLTQKKRWHLVLGTQKSNGNMGSLKAPPILHAFLMLTQFSSYPSCWALQVSKARAGGCRAKDCGCRARDRGCGAKPRLSLPQFKSEGQQEIGNLCREGGCLVCSFASQSLQCSSGYSQLFHSSALGWDLGTRSKGEAAFGCTELFSVWAVKSKHLFKREHSEQ